MLSSKKSPQKIAPSDSYPGHVLQVHNIKYVGLVLVPAYARGSISVAQSRGMGGRAMLEPQLARRGQLLAPPPAASPFSAHLFAHPKSVLRAQPLLTTTFSPRSPRPLSLRGVLSPPRNKKRRTIPSPLRPSASS